MYPKSLSDVYEMLSSHTTHESMDNISKTKFENKQANVTSEHQSSKSIGMNNYTNESTETSYL